MEKEYLISYLKTVLELEKMNYEQNSIMAKMDNSYSYYKSPKYKSLLENKKVYDLFYLNDHLFICKWSFIIVGIIATIISYIDYITHESRPIVGIIKFFLPSVLKGFLGGLIALVLSLIVILIIGIVTKIKVAKENYANSLETQEKNNEIVKYNESLKQVSEYKAKLIEEEYNLFVEKNNDTKQVLQQYYDMNVLYPKYRNMICVSSILDYFLSGVCDKLTGHEGAYNKLDQELLLKQIIGKLDVVISNLEEIKNNQMVLYEAINECNKTIKNVSNKINDSIKRIEKIEETNAKANEKIQEELRSIDYFNRVTAANTQYLADMKQYEILLR